jgi:hypothetical protein
MKLLISILLLFVIGCSSSKTDSLRSRVLLFLGVMSGDPVRLQGKVVKGKIKNANVHIVPLSPEGKCDRTENATILGKTTSDNDGNYAVTYTRQNAPVCVVTLPKADGTSKMYDEKSKEDIPWAGNVYFESIVNEPPPPQFDTGDSVSASKISVTIKNANVTPLTRIASRRTESLVRQNGSGAVTESAKQANREVTVRFGLYNNAGSLNAEVPPAVPDFSVRETNNSSSGSITTENTPEVSTLSQDIDDLTQPESVQLNLLLEGYSHIANGVKASSTPTAEEVDSVVSAFSESMATGEFKNTTERGEGISFGMDANETTLEKDPLKNVLQKAIIETVQEGSGSHLGVTPETVSSNILLFDNDAPAFSPTGSTLVGEQVVKINSPKASAAIRYTIDGTEPGCGVGTEYKDGVTLRSGRTYTLSAVACEGKLASKVATGEYIVISEKLDAVTIAPEAVEHNNSVTVTLSQAQGAPIRYTLDPDEELSCKNGKVYQNPIAMESSFKIKTIACKSETSQSYVNTRNFRIINAPYGLGYEVTSAGYTRGGGIKPNFARVTGERLTFGITPELPAGLVFHTQTGRITGTPTENSSSTEYTVTAGNSAGSTTTRLLITVTDEPPQRFSYPIVSAVYTKGILAQPNIPTISGSGITYSISPALPSGLVLNETTGRISGSPQVLQLPTAYTVTATNTGGSTTFNLSLTVNEAAPASLNYANAPFVFTKGVSILPETPTFSGTVETFSVSPSLPDGLRLDGKTGRISGTPAAVLPTAAYVVSASNAGGSTSFTFSITVEEGAPSALSYANSSFVLTKNNKTNPLLPTVNGSVTAYSVTPSLPTGLIINSRTGEISGTPTAVSEPTEYRVTAANPKGSTSFPISFSVTEDPPASLSYVSSTFLFTKGVVVPVLKPSVTGTVDRYTVDPSLPDGVVLNAMTGVISGTPQVASTEILYTVRASNSKGSSTFTFSMAIEDKAPSKLNYAGSPFLFTKNVSITNILPTISGTATSYSVSPVLPNGLSLNSVTGVLSGTPNSVSANASYTVTATNSFGSTSFVMQIQVTELPPFGLSYGSTIYSFTKGVSINPLQPSITGTPSFYNVSPALPTGLSIHSITGAISGTPTQLSSGSYTITAGNSVGSTSAVLNLVVSDTPPSSLAYNTNSAMFTKDISITPLIPTLSGTATSYLVSPALPSGLSLNSVTGVISGTPHATQASVAYTVTASNASGSTTTVISIGVVDGAPSSLVYSPSTFTFSRYTAIAPVTPAVMGTADTFSVTPALPAGISINSTTGVLSGTPSIASASQTYTVTATNQFGSISTTLTFGVLEAYYTVGGTISGLVGSGLQLQLGSETINATGAGFTFPTALASGTVYNVSVVAQPTSPWQTCTVTNGSGTLVVANVSNVNISCTTNSYTVGGTVSGFSTGTDITVTDSVNTVNIPAGVTTFAFPARLSGSTYSVSITSNPTSPWQTCTITNGSGAFTIGGSNITNVSISCSVNTYTFSGTVTGLGSGNTLSISNGVSTTPYTGNGSAINHTGSLNSGTGYTYTITSQPQGQHCTFIEPTTTVGTVGGSGVSTLDINCVNGYMVGGRIQANPPTPIGIHLYQGNVTILAGSGSSGSSDGTGAGASFNLPGGITFDGNNFYVTDLLNHKIRQITPAGVVTTLAGNGTAGNANGTGAIASLTQPRGIATDGTYLYVSEYTGQRIKRIRISTGYTETIAGDNSTVTPTGGFVDAVGTSARFHTPTSLVLDGNNLFIADRTNSKIRKLDLTTLSVTTVTAGGNLAAPEGLTIVGNYLYTSDITNHSIVRIDKTNGTQTVFAGGSGSGFVDAVGTSAKFDQPTALATDGNDLYVTDFGNRRIRRVEIASQKVTTLAGNGNSSLGNGVGIAASMYPMYITTNGKELYFTDMYTIRKITSNGLVAYFPLTDTALNYAGENNGSFNGSGSFTKTTDRFGTVDKAFVFNGTDQYIDVPHSTQYTSSPMTVSAWFKPTNLPSPGNFQVFVSKSSASIGWALELWNNGGTQNLTWLCNGSTALSVPYTTSTVNWTHAVVSQNGTNAQLYVNGRLLGRTQSCTSLTDSGTSLLIGKRHDGYFFNGNIADVRIYNRSLNDGEINELAQNASQALVGASYSTGATGLLSHFPFDNSSLNDVGPLAKTLANNGSAVSTFGKDGEPNGSFDFSGSNFLSASPVGLPAGNSPRSICLWAKPVSLPNSGHRALLYYGNGATGEANGIGYVWSGSNHTLAHFGYGSDYDVIYASPINTWNHFCGVYDGTNASIYYNGNQMASSAKTWNTVLTNFVIGKSLGTDNFIGKIDDVRIYNNALTSAQIRQLATQVPNGLVARYDFNGDANDVSGFGNHGTIYGSVTPVQDRFGNNNSAYSFSAAGSQYIETIGNVGITGATTRSLSFWMLPANLAVSSNQTIVSWGAPTGSNMFRAILDATNDTVWFSGYGGGLDINSTISFQRNWQHWTFVYNGSNLIIYKDGAQISTTGGTLATTDSHLSIGKLIGGAEYYDGKIDDVRIYNRVLTEPEIRALSGYHPWQVTSWNVNPPTSNLQFHIQADSFDGLADSTGISTSWLDNSGNTNHAAQYGSPLFRTGANGINGKPAIQFNGTTQYFDAGNTGINFSGLTLFTVAKHTDNLPTTYKTVVSKDNSCTGQRFNLHRDQNTNGYFFETNNSVTIAANQNENVILTAINNSNVTLSKNGGSPTPYNSANVSGSTGCPLQIGNRSSAPDAYFQGLIGEVILFNQAIPPSDKDIVECYLSAKYGIPIGHPCP